MARMFQVETPDQLLALQEYAKDGNLARAASIWRTAREKKGDKGTSWDGKIRVTFGTHEGNRAAIVSRAMIFMLPSGHGKSDRDVNLLGGQQPPRNFAHLRYNPALQWCREHLREIK